MTGLASSSVRIPPGVTRRPRLSGPPWLAYAFLSPAIIFYAVFIAAPIVVALGLSFFSYDLISPATPNGGANFVHLFRDPNLGQAILNTLLFAFATIITHIVGGILLALAANRLRNRIVSYFFRAAIFFPFLISWAAVSLTWKFLLDPNFGIATYYLGLLGIHSPSFFTESSWALPTLIFIDFWHSIGFTFIIMLAGLQTVPQELVEAARMDGASSFQVFRNVTVPLMSPTIFFAIVITFIGAFQIFDPVQIITQGGPNNSTLTVSMYLYQQGFQDFNIGYASTLALVIFVVIMAVTGVQFWLGRRWVYEA